MKERKNLREKEFKREKQFKREEGFKRKKEFRREKEFKELRAMIMKYYNCLLIPLLPLAFEFLFPVLNLFSTLLILSCVRLWLWCLNTFDDILLILTILFNFPL